MSSTATDQFVIVFLKLVPFLFSIVVKLVDDNFAKEFDSTWDTYQRRLGYNIGEDEESWRYHLVGLYIYDRRIFSSSLRFSAFLAAVLHLLLWYQEGISILVLPAIGYLIIASLSRKITDKFFIIEEEGRNPDTYEHYYYGRKAKAPNLIRSRFKGLLPLFIDRRLSPVRSSVIIDILILTNVGVLEAVVKFGIGTPNQFLDVSGLSITISGFFLILVSIVLVLQFLDST